MSAYLLHQRNHVKNKLYQHSKDNHTSNNETLIQHPVFTPDYLPFKEIIREKIMLKSSIGFAGRLGRKFQSN